MRMLSAVTHRLRRTDELLRHRISRNANEEDARNLTFADRAADRIARFGGSWKFIIFSLVLLMLWMAANGLLLRERPFDPFPFVLLNLLLGMLASNLLLLGTPFYRAVYVAQAVFYIWAGLGFMFRTQMQRVRFGLVGYFLISMNLAFLVGFWRVLFAHEEGTWQRVE